MTGIDVLVFRSHLAVYGVMASQIARLSRDSCDVGAVEIVDLVKEIEGSVSAGNQLSGCSPQLRVQGGRKYIVVDRVGVMFQIPGPVELRTIELNSFRLIPQIISRCCSSAALRAVFTVDDAIGILVDLSRIRPPAPGSQLTEGWWRR